jgi:hypothetical protein
MNGMHKFLVYTKNVNLLDKNIQTIKKVREALYLLVRRLVYKKMVRKSSISSCPLNRMQQKITA